MIRILTVLLLCIALALTSCNVINPDEPIPTYVRIDSIVLKDASGQRISSKITGASLSYGNNSKVSLLGVFRLPIIIPVLADQAGQIYIVPSVDVDGMLSQMYAYPFYQNVELLINPAPGDTVDYGVVVTYPADTSVSYLHDDFEGGTDFSIGGPDSAASFRIQTDEVKEGDFSALFEIMEPQRYAYIISNDAMQIPLHKTAYIEFDYKCNIDFGVTLLYWDNGIASYRNHSLLGLRKKDDWNKVYIKIDDDLPFLNAPAYLLAFECFKDSTIADAKIYLDNVSIKGQY